MAGSLIGNLIRPVPFCTTFDIRAEYSVLMSLSSKWTSCLKPSTLLVELDPLVHLAFFDVADDVVDRREADRVERARAVAVRVDAA